MWRPLFLYYFLLIAMMTKTMFVNSQQLLYIILFLCELINLHKIHMISLFLFYPFSFIHLGSWQNNQALDSTLIFIIYSSRTRLHIRTIKQNSQLDHTKSFYSTRSKYYQKDRTKKNSKGKSDGDTIPGHCPKLGSCQGECPYPCDYVPFVGEEGGVVDDLSLSSLFQGIGSPS